LWDQNAALLTKTLSMQIALGQREGMKRLEPERDWQTLLSLLPTNFRSSSKVGVEDSRRIAC
jgi:hypothetical protein